MKGDIIMLLKQNLKKNTKNGVKKMAKTAKEIDYALGTVPDILSKSVKKDMEDD